MSRQVMSMVWSGALALTLAPGAVAQDARMVHQEPVVFDVESMQFRGSLFVPEQAEPAPLLVVYHAAYGGDERFPFYRHLKMDLPQAGVATLLFNRRGTGVQPGDFESASFEDLARDGLAAIEAVKNDPRIDADRIGAWGVSQGGWLAPLAATLSDEIDFVIMVSGPGVTPAEQMDYAAAYHLREAGFSDDAVDEALSLRASVNEYYRDPQNREELQKRIDWDRAQPWYRLTFLPDGGNLPIDAAAAAESKWGQTMDYDPTETLERVDVPILAIFGAKDRWVPVDQSVERVRDAVEPDDLLTVWISESSGHFMSGREEPMNYSGQWPVEDAYIDAMVEWIESLEQ